MELGRRAVGAMARTTALLRAAATASSSATSTPRLLQGPMRPLSPATRYGVSPVHPRSGGDPMIAPGSAVRIGFLPDRATSFLGGCATGIRAFSTRNNHERLNEEKFRYFLFRMFQYFKSVIGENHAAAILNIERNRSEVHAQLHSYMHSTMWKWFGALSAVLSVAVSSAYLLYDKRCDMSETHFSKRLDSQDREIGLLRLQTESAPHTADTSVYFMRADQVTEGSLILISDGPCEVCDMEGF